MAEALFDATAQPREFAKTAVRTAVQSLDAATIIGELARAFVRSEQAKSRKA